MLNILPKIILMRGISTKSEEMNAFIVLFLAYLLYVKNSDVYGGTSRCKNCSVN